MAAEDEGRTEQASEYKLEKARKEGRVAKSQEISAALVLLFCVTTIVFLSKWFFSEIITIFRFFFTQCSSADIKNPSFLPAFFDIFIKCVLPLGLISAIAAIAGNLIQTRGFIFSLKPTIKMLLELLCSCIAFDCMLGYTGVRLNLGSNGFRDYN